MSATTTPPPGASVSNEHEKPPRANPHHFTTQATMSRHVTPRHTKTPRGGRVEKRRKKKTHRLWITRDPAPSAAGAVCVLLRSKRIATVNPGHPELKVLLDAGTDVAAFDAAADIAIKADRPSFAYVLGIVKRQAEEASGLPRKG